MQIEEFSSLLAII